MSFDIDVAVRRGDTRISTAFSTAQGATVIFGPSGVGKTSVLQMIAGLLRPDDGHVAVANRKLFDSTTGVDLPPERRRAGYVFQEPRLFPHRRVRANLLYGAPGMPDMWDDAIALLGIGSLLDRWPSSLSGGEARRVAIGRALFSKPDFLLLDEPLSSLDRARRGEVMQVIEGVRDKLGLPILMVTHDPEEARRIGTHIVEM